MNAVKHAARREKYLAHLARRLRAVLADGAGRTRPELVVALQLRPDTWPLLNRALNRLVQAGEVLRGPAREPGGPHVYTGMKVEG